MSRVVGAFVLVVSSVMSTQADEESQRSQVKKLAKEMSQAFEKGDYSKIADLTYPSLVEMAGGKKKMIAIMETVMDKLKDAGIEVRSHTVGEPTPFLEEGSNTFTVIPSIIVMTRKGVKFRSNSYLLGISPDKGKSWTFVDGAGLDNPLAKEKFLPKFPSKLKLPKKEALKLISD